ncbi:MAG TPA: hypothetical protein VHD38_01195 [Candidatus Paceibacterota bacterium]|nr:hypothetical protein [Candidatus Paceibacterota bacterium]
MKALSRLVWGVVIYSMMYLLWSGFLIYGFTGAPSRIIGLVALVILSIIAGRALRLSTWKDVLPYSIAWAVLIGIFDAVFSVPYTGWYLYTDWSLWVGYGLVVVVPLLAPYTRGREAI